MSNRPRTGSESAVIPQRHGRKGHVCLTTTVPPELKDDLVEYCVNAGVTMKAAIEGALWMLLSAPDAEKRRWYGS